MGRWSEDRWALLRACPQTLDNAYELWYSPQPVPFAFKDRFVVSGEHWLARSSALRWAATTSTVRKESSRSDRQDTQAPDEIVTRIATTDSLVIRKTLRVDVG